VTRRSSTSRACGRPPRHALQCLGTAALLSTQLKSRTLIRLALTPSGEARAAAAGARTTRERLGIAASLWLSPLPLPAKCGLPGSSEEATTRPAGDSQIVGCAPSVCIDQTAGRTQACYEMQLAPLRRRPRSLTRMKKGYRCQGAAHRRTSWQRAAERRHLRLATCVPRLQFILNAIHVVFSIKTKEIALFAHRATFSRPALDPPLLQQQRPAPRPPPLCHVSLAVRAARIPHASC
jgi:hypothetical protein